MKFVADVAHTVRLDVVALAVVVNCGGSGSASGHELKNVTLAPPPIDTCSELFTAKEMDYFEKEGLDVDAKVLPSGKAISAGVLGGSLDGGCASIGSLAGAVARDLPLGVIPTGAVYNSEAPTSQLVVAANSSISTVRDLEGRTIAVDPLTSFSQTGTQQWLDASEGDSATTKFIEMPNVQMAAALKSERVDPGLLVEPSLTTAMKAGVVRVIANPFDAVGKEFMITVIFSSDKLAKDQADVVTKLQAALKRARSFSNDNPDKTAVMLSKYTDLPTETAESMTRASWPADLQYRELQGPLDNAPKYKVLSKPLNASAMLAPGVS